MSPSVNFDLGEREDHSRAAFHCCSLPFQKLFQEVPWKHEVIIWLHGAGFLFADDGNVGPYSARTMFVRVAIGSKIDEAIVNVAPLKDRVTLSGCAIDVNIFAISFDILDK